MNRVASNEEQAFPANFIDAFRPDIVVMSYVEMRLGPCEGPCQDVVPISHIQDVRQARLRRLFGEARGAKAASPTHKLARFTNNGAEPATVRVASATSGPLEGEASEAVIPPGGSALLFLTSPPVMEGAGAASTVVETVDVAENALPR